MILLPHRGCGAAKILIWNGGYNMASNRILLINEEIQKELSSLLRKVKDPRVQDVMISITRVETTPDLR